MLVTPEHAGYMTHQLFVSQRPVTAYLVIRPKRLANRMANSLSDNEIKTKKTMFPKEHGLLLSGVGT